MSKLALLAFKVDALTGPEQDLTSSQLWKQYISIQHGSEPSKEEIRAVCLPMTITNLDSTTNMEYRFRNEEVYCERKWPSILWCI